MTLAAEAKRLKCRLFSVDEFIEKVFIPASYRNGATIVGFNLPFDLSQIAIGFQPARPVYPRKAAPVVPTRTEKVDRSMVGGFTFIALSWVFGNS